MIKELSLFVYFVTEKTFGRMYTIKYKMSVNGHYSVQVGTK